MTTSLTDMPSSFYWFYRERGCLVTFQLWTTEDGGEYFKILKPRSPNIPVYWGMVHFIILCSTSMSSSNSTNMVLGVIITINIINAIQIHLITFFLSLLTWRKLLTPVICLSFYLNYLITLKVGPINGIKTTSQIGFSLCLIDDLCKTSDVLSTNFCCWYHFSVCTFQCLLDLDSMCIE